ncbi:MAG: hypothetical protein AAGN35_22390 [Bacteroidota bacterium]
MISDGVQLQQASASGVQDRNVRGAGLVMEETRWGFGIAGWTKIRPDSGNTLPDPDELRDPIQPELAE